MFADESESVTYTADEGLATGAQLTPEARVLVMTYSV